MITSIEDFFGRGCGRCARFDTPACSARIWRVGLATLRGLCRETGMAETVKWGHPCYTHAGRNIALIGALRADMRLSFFNARLLRDPENLLERQGPNARQADTIRFASAEQVDTLAPVLRAYLTEAMGYAAEGLKAPKLIAKLEIPDDLDAALDADPALWEAFAALTPERQRSYVLALGTAKTQATRLKRIGTYRDRILAGKGATER